MFLMWKDKNKPRIKVLSNKRAVFIEKKNNNNNNNNQTI